MTGKLDIRPPVSTGIYLQDKQRDAVINTVTKNFPLNLCIGQFVKMEHLK